MALKDLVRKGRPAKPSRQPQPISETTWFYDDPKGILVVHEARGNGGEYLQTDQFIIPWSKLRRALRRNGRVA